MAYSKKYSLLAQIFCFSFLLAVAQQALAKCNIPTIPENADVKQPEWLIKSDHGVVIPDIGEIPLPPGFGMTPSNPFTGRGIGTGSSGGDTFVPNPGFEVPNPGSGGGIPPQSHA